MTAAERGALAARLAGPPGRVHAMGAGGVGVAGLAALLAARGWRVTGCDAAPGPLTAWLAGRGVAVAPVHDPAHAEGCELLVRTAAVPDDHPEILRARATGVAVARRGEALAALLDGFRTVAVCGTHGKTTTACFTTRLLQALGAAPGWCIGGCTAALGTVADPGGGVWMVAEADESDGTLAEYRPEATVITNVDFDHMEHFGDEAALLACFAAVARATTGTVVYGADDARARRAAAASPRATGFGFGPEADWRAEDVRLEADAAEFGVVWRGRDLGRVRFGAPGRHNVLNALAAAATAVALGHDPARVLALLPAAAGLPARRFERVANTGGIQAVSDYAHHPAEIAALVAAARLQGARRLLAVFQPHRYTRTRALGAAFPAAFEGVDEQVLVPVYAASEEPVEGGTLADLYARFRERQTAAPPPRLAAPPATNAFVVPPSGGPFRLKPVQQTAAAPNRGCGPAAPPPRLAASPAEAWACLRPRLAAGDFLLAVGAGDISRLAEWAGGDIAAGRVGSRTPAGRAGRLRWDEVTAALARLPGIRVAADVPAGSRTGFGCGGAAAWVAGPEDEAALAGLLRFVSAEGLAWAVLGAGANTLVPDLGFPGVLVRLDGAVWRGFRREGDEVEAGCGLAGAALLDRLEEEGLSGLEFLEGVPGQVGGWVAMNAGAHGGAIGERVTRIRCLNCDGSAAIVSGLQAGFGYRSCEALRGRTAVAVRLRLEPSSRDEVRARRLSCRARRLDLVGLRTAGSVFRNPPGGFAGRLLEEAGCKGMSVGGAAVLGRHANVIAAGDGATASDVEALMALMWWRVWRAKGVALVPEVRVLSGETRWDASGRSRF